MPPTPSRAPKVSTPTVAAQERGDAQIRDLQQEIKYDLRDFTVDYLVRAYREDLFFVPAYQREFIWPERHKSKFIESLILGLPIPMLFVADLADGRLEIVDGAQRVQTLEQFIANELRLSGLKLLGELNGFRFGDLSTPQQRKFLTRALRLVVLEDGTSEAIRQELFHRINTQSVKAKGSEIRRGSFQGPFVDFIKNCAADARFLRLCPISPAMLLRREDEELVTRFFCYSETYLSFKHDVDKFLDAYVATQRGVVDTARLSDEFHQTMRFVENQFPFGFAKARTATTTPRVRFEAIAVGANLALRQDPHLVPSEPPSRWLDSDEFVAATTTHASNSGPRLRSRIQFVRDRLLRN